MKLLLTLLLLIPFTYSALSVVGQEPTTKIIDKTKVVEDESYSMSIPQQWAVKKISEQQLMIVGPKVGTVHAAIYVTKVPRGDKNYLMAAEQSQKQLSPKKNYSLTAEKDLSGPDFKALERKSHWYEKDIDMVLFTREIFTQSETEVFILSGSIPSTKNIAELDKVIASVFSSFRLK